MKKRIHFLLEKYRTGKLNESELDELYSSISALQKDEGKIWDQSELERDLREIKPVIEEQRSRFFNLRWFHYAACAALLLVSGLGYVYFSGKTPEQLLASDMVDMEASDKPAGTFKAYMKGSDDTDYVLLDSTSMQISSLLNKKEHDKSETVWQSLHTPAGAEYKVELEDGTFLWINAGSTVRFPTHFTTDKREIHIAGDVLLHVKHQNGMPFLVYTDQQQIEVKGTLFHVNANKNRSITTLIEGSVVTSNVDGAGSIHISPGESIRGENGQQKFTTVSIDEILAWRDGYFYFENKPLEDILQKLAVWYNVKIERAGVDTSVRLNARISKNKGLMEITKIFTMSTGIQFKLINNTLTLKK